MFYLMVINSVPILWAVLCQALDSFQSCTDQYSFPHQRRIHYRSLGISLFSGVLICRIPFVFVFPDFSSNSLLSSGSMAASTSSSCATHHYNSLQAKCLGKAHFIFVMSLRDQSPSLLYIQCFGHL